jgi:hypothetical protein
VYELYDLDADPNELHNLYGEKKLADTVHELKTALQEKMILDFDYLPLPIPSNPKKAAAKRAGKNGPDRAALFEKLDANHDGRLSKEEFSAGRIPDEADAWFKARDLDHDGYLNREEFMSSSVPNPPHFEKKGNPQK